MLDTRRMESRGMTIDMGSGHRKRNLQAVKPTNGVCLRSLCESRKVE